MQTIKSNKAMQCKLFYTYEAPPFTSHLYISAALCCFPKSGNLHLAPGRTCYVRKS